MNAAVGTLRGVPVQEGGPSMAPNYGPVWGPWLDGSGAHGPFGPHGKVWRTYGKISDTQPPGPSMVWVLMDEDEYSINIACFSVIMQTGPTKILNWPGTYHGNSASLSFLDGHAEIHKWKDPRTKKPDHQPIFQYGSKNTLLFGPLTSQGNPDNQDILWLQQHTSAPAK